MSQIAHIFDALTDAEFRKEIEHWARETMTMAEAFCNDNVEGFEDLRDDWSGSLSLAMANSGWPTDVFAKALDEARLPHVITPEELTEAFTIYLDERDHRVWNDFDVVYEAFLDHVRYRVLPHRSAQFDVCHIGGLPEENQDRAAWYVQVGQAFGKAEVLGNRPEIPPPPDSKDEADDANTPSVIQLSDDVRLTFPTIRREDRLRRGSRGAGSNKCGTLEGEIDGRISSNALTQLEAEVAPVARSITNSVSLLNVDDGMTVAELEDKWPFIAASVRALFAPAGKKDTIPRRTGNAVRLLAEADRQRSTAVRLALCVTAVDAVLGSNNPAEISKSLAERVAVLLEPDTTHRQRACEFVKQMYNRRSQTLHGDLVGDEASARQARVLAAACLYAVWLVFDAQTRLEGTEYSVEGLLKSLKEKQWHGTRPDWVPDLPAVRNLWKP